MFDIERLTPLFLKLSKEYASYETESLPYQKGQEIMASILYILEEAENTNTPISQNPDIERIYKQCLSLKKDKISTYNEKLNHLLNHFNSFNNTCYKDTVKKALPGFFKFYDVKFDAENSIITLDYPSLNPYSKSVGIDLIAEYIDHLEFEVTFLNSFPGDIVKETLKNHHKDYENLIINIPSILYNNGIASILLKESIYLTKVSSKAIDHLNILSNTFDEYSLLEAHTQLFKNLNITNVQVDEYFKEYNRNLYNDWTFLHKQGILKKLFT